jgi:hypothetical protein
LALASVVQVALEELARVEGKEERGLTEAQIEAAVQQALTGQRQ